MPLLTRGHAENNIRYLKHLTSCKVYAEMDSKRKACNNLCMHNIIIVHVLISTPNHVDKHLHLCEKVELCTSWVRKYNLDKDFQVKTIQSKTMDTYLVLYKSEIKGFWMQNTFNLEFINFVFRS